MIERKNTDFWKTTVQGEFGLPDRCHSFQAKGKKQIGFANMVRAK